MKQFAFGLLLLALSTACASLGSDRKRVLNVAELSTEAVKPVAVKAQSGLADYTFAATNQKAEWIDCRGPSEPQATILLMHRDRAGWDREKFCTGWIAQAFVSQGFEVLGINRPGYGQSTGTADFSGAASMAALDAGIQAAQTTAKQAKPLSGIWGYSTGATAAALYAKHAGSTFKFAIFGGGIYDFEETLKVTQDLYVKSDIEQIQKTGGNKAIEERSVGYDVSGLPKLIAIYHGKGDQTAPIAQAQAFADSLASNGGSTVTFQAIDGASHEIPWVQHWKLLEVFSRSAAGLPERKL